MGSVCSSSKSGTVTSPATNPPATQPKSVNGTSNVTNKHTEINSNTNDVGQTQKDSNRIEDETETVKGLCSVYLNIHMENISFRILTFFLILLVVDVYRPRPTPTC